MPQLPKHPFAEAIEEWNKMVADNRAEFQRLNGYEIPDGMLPVSAEFRRAWKTALAELD